ncbi:MAG: hypothetical protein ACJ8DI_20240 [Ktedonobacteraceae bacterium]
MQHPTFGLMAPDQFIPLAEQTGLIRPLTFWVLEAAVRGVAVYRQTPHLLGAGSCSAGNGCVPDAG